MTRPFFHRVESLRGVGAVIVAAWHVSGWQLNGVQLLPHAAWSHASALQNAVGRFELALLPAHAALVVFFVISGFVLRVSLQYGPQDAGAAAARFHVARFFRIYPIVAFSMLLAALAHGWQVPAELGREATAVTVATLFANMALLDVSLNTTLWAIQLEVVMAPFIVALYFLERRHGPRVLIAIAVVTSLLSFGNWTPWRPLSHNFFAFVLGMLVPTFGRALVKGLSGRSANRLLIGIAVALFLPSALFGLFSRYSGFLEGYLAFVLVSLIAYRLDLSGARWLDGRGVRLLGVSSGSYYVLHMSILIWIVPIIGFAVPADMSQQFPAFTGALVIGAAAAALAVPALLSHYVVEAPGIALGRRVIAAARRPSLA